MLVHIDGPCGPIVPAQHQQPPIAPSRMGWDGMGQGGHLA